MHLCILLLLHLLLLLQFQLLLGVQFVLEGRSVGCFALGAALDGDIAWLTGTWLGHFRSTGSCDLQSLRKIA